ncbi:MAG: hypothetical protein OQL09_05755 [Gammaproteobacteria bacterium]|nr:hypothetical protein [Gammaproteobacteria bacterium]
MKTYGLLLISLLGLLTACTDIEESNDTLVLSVSDVIKPDDTDYQLPFLVQLKNEDGSALANTQVDVSIEYLQYHKGNYIQYDCDGDGYLDCWAITSGDGGSLTAVCPTEDSNNNGELDDGEDINFNGTMEPNRSVAIAAHPSETPTLNADNSLLTDDTGSVFFILSYPQTETGWSQLRITASADISGSIASQSYDFTLPATVADLTNLTKPPGGVAPSKYGISVYCTDSW